ncbi:MAG: peptidase MA family metallohydrolase [Polyangiales bacterium]
MKFFRRLVALALVSLLWMFSAREARAQTVDLTARIAPPRGARDLVDGPYAPGSMTIPALPVDHVTARRGPLTISYPRALEPVVAQSLRRAEGDARAIAAQLGMHEIPQLTVRLVADPDMMRRLAPVEAPPPDYAVGVAYPAVRLALVSSMAPRTWSASNMAQVLRHELSHLLLAEATHHATLPRWLSEGVAVHQADEHSFERFEALASASWTGRLLPLRRLDEGFSEGADQVNAAYAESTDFVGYLLRIDGPTRFAILVDHLREGMPLEEAIEQTYGASMPRVEDEWRRDLDGRVAFAPLWAGTGLLSIGGAVLVVAALIRRKLKNRATLARWESEERARRTNRWMLLSRPPLRLVPQPAPEARREDELPRVQHDGSEHTLH